MFEDEAESANCCGSVMGCGISSPFWGVSGAAGLCGAAGACGASCARIAAPVIGTAFHRVDPRLSLYGRTFDCKAVKPL